jgi:hypothetical protein
MKRGSTSSSRDDVADFAGNHRGGREDRFHVAAALGRLLCCRWSLSNSTHRQILTPTEGEHAGIQHQSHLLFVPQITDGFPADGIALTRGGGPLPRTPR